MKFLLLFFTLFFTVFSQKTVPGIRTDSISCTPTINGKTYDLTSLVNKSGFYYFAGVSNNTNYFFQLQICQNIQNNPIKACSSPAAVTQVSVDNSTCFSLGDIAVSAWDVNAYQDGINLVVYHGDLINNVQRRSSIIYLVCDKSTTLPIFEHERLCTDPSDGLQFGAQYHFSISTPLVC